MAYLIPPELATRLQATAFVQDAELQSIGSELIVRSIAKDMADAALHKLLNQCITIEDRHQDGRRGKVLNLDVYVIAPHELRKVLAEAMSKGESDAMRWSSMKLT